jgi:hypothetical protein
MVRCDWLRPFLRLTLPGRQDCDDSMLRYLLVESSCLSLTAEPLHNVAA